MIEVATKISKEERVGVDQRYIKSHFEYDNGRMIRKKGDSPGAKVGHWEWSINRDGYRKIKIKQATFEVHRLVWVMHNGYIPVGLQIDHINRDRLDNRIENLRLVTHRQNAENNCRNMSGVPGVHWNKRDHYWQVAFRKEGALISVGRFKDFDVACEARKQAMADVGIAVCS